MNTETHKQMLSEDLRSAAVYRSIVDYFILSFLSGITQEDSPVLFYLAC